MILVFGSLNIDLVVRVKSLPAPGETVLGPSYDVVAGGKGANQALAAARAGAAVAMLGAVGKDAFSEIALAELAAAAIDLAGVARKGPRTGSGCSARAERKTTCWCSTTRMWRCPRRSSATARLAAPASAAWRSRWRW